MNDRLQRDEALSAEYALGTLSGLARLRFARRLRNEPALAANVARWQALLASLDNQLAPVTPPEKVWKKITLSLPEKSAPPHRRFVGWLLAASIAAIALVASIFLQQPTLTPLTVLSDAQHREQWVLSADSKLAQLSLTPLHPAALTASNSLELWVIPAGKAPISLGLVDSENATDIALKDPELARSGMIAISLEPRGGSPTGQPTGPVLYSGQL